MKKYLFAVFSEVSEANMALDELASAGFSKGDISVVVKDAVVHQRMENANTTANNVTTGAATGALSGGALGGLVGFLAGVAAITIPGLGALLIGGPIAAALGLTGAAATTVSGAVTGAVAGGLIGGLVGLGVPEDQARKYQQRIEAGDVLIITNVEDEGRKEEAQAIMSKHGATEINYYTSTQ